MLASLEKLVLRLLPIWQHISIVNSSVKKKITLFIRTSAQGAYLIFSLLGWALIRGWALIQINMVIKSLEILVKPCSYILSKFRARLETSEQLLEYLECVLM